VRGRSNGMLERITQLVNYNIRVITSRRIIWRRHLGANGKEDNSRRILVGKPETEGTTCVT
jgi:hypothetical protein